VIEEFVTAQHSPEPEIRNYEDWLRASYGDTFAETFPMEYTKKYHTTHAKNLTTDWIGRSSATPSTAASSRFCGIFRSKPTCG
jgi:protoporphyrinogen oxidase